MEFRQDGFSWETFCTTCHFEKGAPEILRWAQQNYRLGIISNGTGAAQRRRLQSGDIFHYFDSLIISDEVVLVIPNLTRWKPDYIIK